MPRYVRTRLSALMFLFYGSLGAWAVTIATYLRKPGTEGGLGFDSHQVAWIFSTYAIGGVLANPLVGLLADRLFRAERLFAAACSLCGVFLLAAAWWCQRCEPLVAGAGPDRLPGVTAGAFAGLFAIMLAYSLCLQVALPLCSVLALRNLTDPTRQFSHTRLWGTVGWVAVGLLMGLVIAPVSNQPFLLAGGLAAAVGVYALTLPPTPPWGHGRSLGEAFGLPALGLFRHRSFVAFVLGGLVLSVMNQFYGTHGHSYLTAAGWEHAERWMVIGQVVEVGCMFAIPLLDPKRRMKWLMLAGAVGGAVRGAALAWGPAWVQMAVGVPMHGWQFAFYFVTAITFVDRLAPPHLRASAQAIAAFVGGGVGPLLGNALAAEVLERCHTAAGTDWTTFWLVPLAGCGLAAVGFAVLFRTPTDSPTAAVAVPSGRLTHRRTADDGSKVLGG
jgi:MFS family permease